jgi:hypothetical protein
MLTSLIGLLLVLLVLVIIYWAVSRFVTGTPLTIIGIILGLVFLVYALRTLGIREP